MVDVPVGRPVLPVLDPVAPFQLVKLKLDVLDYLKFGTDSGKVIIQSSMPNHFVIQAVLNQNYEALLERELDERQKFAYPPYFRLIKIIYC